MWYKKEFVKQCLLSETLRSFMYCNSCILFQICLLFSIDLSISAFNVIYDNDGTCNWRGFKIRDDGARDEHVSRFRQGYFCIFNDAY